MASHRNQKYEKSKEEGELSEDGDDSDDDFHYNQSSSNGHVKTGYGHTVSSQRQRFHEETYLSDATNSQHSSNFMYTGNDRLRTKHSRYNDTKHHHDHRHELEREKRGQRERAENYDHGQYSNSIDRNNPVLSTPTSRMWKKRRFRASSVRPLSPPQHLQSSQGQYSPSTQFEQDHQHALSELEREKERIRKQLLSLEEEEKAEERSSGHQNEGAKTNHELVESAIALGASPSHLLLGVNLDSDAEEGNEKDEATLENDLLQLEDISQDEDFDEQELRRLALASSARHNQLLASGTSNKAESQEKADDAPVVVIPDLEPEAKEPEVVIVPEGDDVAHVSTKNKQQHKGKESQKARSSKSRQKNKSRKRKRDTSKTSVGMKSSISSKCKNLSPEVMAKNIEVLKNKATNDPRLAIEEFLEKVGMSKKLPPIQVTGTMRDFKKQKQLPLLNDSLDFEVPYKKIKTTQEKTGHEKNEANKKSGEKRSTGILQDNYEEVEMDIDTDAEDNGHFEKGTAHEKLHLRDDFSQAMQPISVPSNVATSQFASSLHPICPSDIPLPGAPFKSLKERSNFAHDADTSQPPLPPIPPPPQPPPPPPPTSVSPIAKDNMLEQRTSNQNVPNMLIENVQIHHFREEGGGAYEAPPFPVYSTSANYHSLHILCPPESYQPAIYPGYGAHTTQQLQRTHKGFQESPEIPFVSQTSASYQKMPEPKLPKLSQSDSQIDQNSIESQLKQLRRVSTLCDTRNPLSSSLQSSSSHPDVQQRFYNIAASRSPGKSRSQTENRDSTVTGGGYLYKDNRAPLSPQTEIRHIYAHDSDQSGKSPSPKPVRHDKERLEGLIRKSHTRDKGFAESFTDDQARKTEKYTAGYPSAGLWRGEHDASHFHGVLRVPVPSPRQEPPPYIPTPIKPVRPVDTEEAEDNDKGKRADIDNGDSDEDDAETLRYRILLAMQAKRKAAPPEDSTADVQASSPKPHMEDTCASEVSASNTERDTPNPVDENQSQSSEDKSNSDEDPESPKPPPVLKRVWGVYHTEDTDQGEEESASTKQLPLQPSNSELSQERDVLNDATSSAMSDLESKGDPHIAYASSSTHETTLPYPEPGRAGLQEPRTGGSEGAQDSDLPNEQFCAPSVSSSVPSYTKDSDATEPHPFPQHSDGDKSNSSVFHQKLTNQRTTNEPLPRPVETKGSVSLEPYNSAASLKSREFHENKSSPSNEQLSHYSHRTMTQGSDNSYYQGRYFVPNTALPIHPAVIVPLHSSDEEDDNTEEQNHEKTIHHSKDIADLDRQDLMLFKQKASILENQKKLKSLIEKMNKSLNAQRQAQESQKVLFNQIAKLQEKLRVVKRIAKIHGEQKDKAQKEASHLNNTLLKEKSVFVDNCKSLMALGQTLVGPDYLPKAVKNLQTQYSEVKNLDRRPLTNAQRIALEKKKLQQKEKEIAEKLKKLKKQHSGTQHSVGKAQVKSMDIVKRAPEKTQDVIRLGKESSLDITTPRKRRKSLILTDSSTTPKLPMISPRSSTKGRKASADGETGSETERTSDNIRDTMETKIAAFKMPHGVQLTNLCQIQKERVERALKSTYGVVETLPADRILTSLGVFETTPKIDWSVSSTKQKKQPDSLLEKQSLSTKYTSPLMMLRAYRLSPYFRMQENKVMTSETCSHKLNPNLVLCPYDLQGTCNDDVCKQQHPKDYRLSDHELLEDLASYNPQVVPSEEMSDEQAKKSVDSYVESIVGKHKERLTTEQLCLVLTMQTVHAAKATGHSLLTHQRAWRPKPKEEKGLNLHLESRGSNPGVHSIDMSKNRRAADKDTIVSEEDLRYFTSESTELLSLENGVLEDPRNIQLWQKLSSRRLADPNNSPEEALDLALNVLARGLESNRDSPELWLSYLKLYQNHWDPKGFPQFCETALEYAPSYELWHTYLSSLTSYHEKKEVCGKALDFLFISGRNLHSDSKAVKSPTVPDKKLGCGDAQANTEPNEGTMKSNQLPFHHLDRAKLSHQALELIVLTVDINISSGRLKTALKFLQRLLGIKESAQPVPIPSSSPIQWMMPTDSIALWMIYIHVLEWHHLPTSLLSSRLVFKQIHLPWSSKTTLSKSVNTLVNLHWKAAELWNTSNQDQEATKMYCHLVQSLISLLVAQERCNDAIEACDRVLSKTPSLIDVWLAKINTLVKSESKKTEQVINQAIASNRLNAKLQFHKIQFLQMKGYTDQALSSLEQFVSSHFTHSLSASVNIDPGILFGQLLRQDVPTVYMSTVLPEVSSDLHKDVYHWMCYCCLLELQGKTDATVDLFEHALTQMQTAEDLVVVWKNYLVFLMRCPLVSQTFPDLKEVLLRSIISVPTRFDLPFSSPPSTIVDYRHSNQVAEAWLQVLPAGKQLDVLEMGINFMPGNTELLLRALDLCLKLKELRRAFNWCKMAAAQAEKPNNPAFWKIATALAQREGTQAEVVQILISCVETLPLAVSGWKDFLLFEVSRENGEAVEKLLFHCQQSGLNIEGFVATISSN